MTDNKFNNLFTLPELELTKESSQHKNTLRLHDERWKSLRSSKDIGTLQFFNDADLCSSIPRSFI